MIFDQELITKSKSLLARALKSKITITSAESCTGGLVAALITQIPGSSQIFERGFIVYSDLSKREILGVKKSTLKKYGAVSSQTAAEMAIGAIKNSAADLSISITGIAGPASDNSQKPVGLTYIASYNKLNRKLINKELHFLGNRDEIRIACLKEAIRILTLQINSRYS